MSKKYLNLLGFSLLVLGQTEVFAGGEGEGSSSKIKAIDLLKADSVKNVTAKLLSKLKVDGLVRFNTIYRNMNESYKDMTTSKQNISFVDYPQTNGGAAQMAGYPMMELTFAAKAYKNVDVNVGYSHFHAMKGTADKDGGKTLTSIQNLRFNGTYSNNVGKFAFNAGSGLTATLSPFTMGQPNYRDDYFDRLPWDWYRKSYLRYEEYFTLASNVGNQSVGRSQFSGVSMDGHIKPLDLNVKGLFGRSNFTVGNSQMLTEFPAMLTGAKVEKVIFKRNFDGKFGVNFYQRKGYTSAHSSKVDENRMMSIDFNARIHKIIFSGEFAKSDINNPKYQGNGIGYHAKIEIDKKLSTLPFSVEFYNIDKNVVSLDGGIINTNPGVNIGGYNAAETNPQIYDNALMQGLAQEVGMLSNNRMGFNFMAEKKIRNRLNIQIAHGISQERENVNNHIMIQHKVNSFSRSRFRPWFMAGGNYNRIHSNWRRTFEEFVLNDVNRDYKKGFSTTDITLRYRRKLLKKDIVMFLYNSYSTIQQNMPIVPSLTNSPNVFIRSNYTVFDVAYKLSSKYTLVGQVGIERVIGGNRIASDGNTLFDGDLGPDGTKNNGLTVNQTGKALAFGIDYDFAKTAGLHLRHRFFNHADKNFVLDKYSGQETSLELKIFFQ